MAEPAAHPLAIDFVDSLRRVRAEYGKPAWAQLAEIAVLGLSGNRLAATDYYRYGLYDDARHDWASKRSFVGDRRCPDVFRRLVNPGWVALVSDKLVSAAFLERHGFRLPAVRAVHHESRGHPGAASLPDDAALAAWLHEAELPLFAKPIRGFQGRGAVRIDGREAGKLVLHDGSKVAVEAFVASLHARLASLRAGAPGPDPAYLFQELVVQHPEVEARCGRGVACVRAMLGVERRGVRELAWIWKIAAPGEPADNVGGVGNLLAALDPESGEVTRVVQGCGLDQRSFEKNPHTGAPLVGWRLPGFAALREAVLRGAALLPEVRAQSWDVALGPEGPVVIEVNPAGTHALPQLATGRGYWTPETRAFLWRAERENPSRPRGLARLAGWGHPLRRLNGAWRLLRAVAAGRPHR